MNWFENPLFILLIHLLKAKKMRTASNCNDPLHSLPPLGSQPMVGIKTQKILFV